MKLDIESLRTLKTVAEVGSVNTAADMLCISRSAVSWKLKRLHDRIGTPIIQRDGRGIKLTDAGVELLGYAEQILVIHDEAVRRFASVDVQGTVRVGVTEGASGPLLDTVAPWARRQSGELDVHIRIDQPVSILERLADGRIDLAVTMVLPEQVLSTDVLLWDDDLAWAQGTDSSFDRGLPLPLVTFGPRCFYAELARDLLVETGIEYDVVIESPSIAGVQAALASGAGIALTNRRLLTDDHLDLTGELWADNVPLPKPPNVQYIIRASSTSPNEATEFLISQIRTAFTSAESGSLQP